MSDLNDLGERLVKSLVGEVLGVLNPMLEQLNEAKASKKQREVVLRAILMALRSVEMLMEQELSEVQP